MEFKERLSTCSPGTAKVVLCSSCKVPFLLHWLQPRLHLLKGIPQTELEIQMRRYFVHQVTFPSLPTNRIKLQIRTARAEGVRYEASGKCLE